MIDSDQSLEAGHGRFLLQKAFEAAEKDPEMFQEQLDQAGGAAWEPEDLLEVASALKPADLWRRALKYDPDLPQKLKRLSLTEAATSVVRALPPVDEIQDQ